MEKCQEAFAERLQELMNEKGISQNQLAQAINMSSGSVSKYRSGHAELKMVTLEKFADYFDVSVDYLMGRTNCKKYDGSIQAASKFTNLSDDSLKILHKMDSTQRCFLDAIIQHELFESLLKCFQKLLGNRKDYLCTKHFCEYIEQNIDRYLQNVSADAKGWYTSRVHFSAKKRYSTQKVKDGETLILFSMSNIVTDIAKDVCIPKIEDKSFYEVTELEAEAILAQSVSRAEYTAKRKKEGRESNGKYTSKV